LLFLVVLAAAFVSAACPGNPPPAPPSPNADSIAAAERARQEAAQRAQDEADRLRREEEERMRRERDAAAERARSTEELRSVIASVINFDYDRADIRSGDARSLDYKVGVLLANPGVRLRISGHCDERGSDEYNLALGNRRANSSKQYLVSHGIDAGRIETVSFGEERPMEQGHNEASWAKNRRAEFEIIAGGDALVRP
jgi:peptidoglycan-associated lipoprotein